MGPDIPNRGQPLASWMRPANTAGLGTAQPTAEPLASPLVIHAAPTFDLGKYGDIQTYPCIFPGAQNELAILRPTKSVRQFLLVVNDLVIPNVIRVNFDAPAGPTIGVPIPAGGNFFLDYFVPQQDIHVYSPIAGVIMCFYSNANAADAERIFRAISG